MPEFQVSTGIKHHYFLSFAQYVIAAMRDGCIKNDIYDEYWSIRYADFLPLLRTRYEKRHVSREKNPRRISTDVIYDHDDFMPSK